MNKDIAIIGMAGRFPDARNISELFGNLKQGIDSVRPITEKRLAETTLSADKHYKSCGYLDDIDKFDYKLFHLSYAEAVNMSPAHRLPLEVVYETFENAGYDPDHFSGSNTSVYITDSVSKDYTMHAPGFNPTLVTGNSSEFMASMISRIFNLLGNSALVNTACSSALVALHMACNELLLGDADQALVCGVNVNVNPIHIEEYELGLASPDGKSRAFSAQASGMSMGETICAVLIKPLDAAIRDHDQIHAVIRGYASNNNGARSSSILAPHSELQSEVICKAWERAGIDPRTIGYIEAHGSGTALGDTLEVEGLNLAFSKYTDRRQFVPISTIKSNIGHCMLAAGLAGLLKAVLAVKHHVLFPSIHCRELNPHIHFEGSPVFVQQETAEWRSAGPRIAGVTSLGRGGVNSHLVLQEYIAAETPCAGADGYRLLTVSGNSPGSFRENLIRLKEYLSSTKDISLADLAYTLNSGRRHYPFRWAAIVSNRDQAVAALEDAIKAKQPENPPAVEDSQAKICLVLADSPIPDELIGSMTAIYPLFSEQREYASALGIQSGTGLRSFLFRYCCCRLLAARGFSTSNFLSAGRGKFIKEVLAGHMEPGEAILQAAGCQTLSTADLPEKVRAFAQKGSGEPILLLNIGVPDAITAEFERQAHKHIRVLHFPVSGEGLADPLLQLEKELYLSGVALPWPQLFARQEGRRITLPGYAFEKTRCWLRETAPVKAGEAIATGRTANDVSPVRGLAVPGNEIETQLGYAFAEILGLETVLPEDDFFALGGDSLKASKLVRRLNGHLSEKLDFEDIFDFPTVQRLGHFIAGREGVESIVRRIWEDTLRVKNPAPHTDFFASGGHSLLANQLLGKIRKLFNARLDFEDIFSNPTLGALTTLVQERISVAGISGAASPAASGAASSGAAAAGPGRGHSFPRAEKADHYPASFAQQRILYLEKMYKTDNAYNGTNIFLVEGPLDEARLESAFRSLIERHESLRSSFQFIKGRPVQVLHDRVFPEIRYSDLSAQIEELGLHGLARGEGILCKEDREALRLFIEKIAKDFASPFDLERPPMIHIGLTRLAADCRVLIYEMAHIVSDRVTHSVLVREFIRLYQGETLPEPAVQYKDFACWENRLLQSSAFGLAKKFWTENFSTLPPELNLPTDRPRTPGAGYDGDTYDFFTGEELTARIRQAAISEGVTNYIFMLSALTVFLHRLTGARDIVIGSPYSQRDRAGLEEMVGVLLNTLAFRNFPSPEKPFREFLAEVKRNALQVHQHHDYPFELLLDNIGYRRRPGRTPLFDVVLNSQTIASGRALGTFAGDNISIDDLRFTAYNYRNRYTHFDLAIDMDELGKGIHFKTYFKTGLFEKDTIRYLMQEFLQLTDLISLHPEWPLGRYPVLQRQSVKEAPKKIKIKMN